MRLRADTAIMLRIALRNLFAGRSKTLIIGGIILAACAFVVTGLRGQG